MSEKTKHSRLIYLFHPTHTVWIWHIPVGTPHVPHRPLCHHTLCVPFHGIQGVREMQVSVLMTHNTGWCTGYEVCSSCDYTATVAVATRMLHNPNQYSDLLLIHWGIHSQGEMHWSTILLKWYEYLLHYPTVAGLWYNIIPQLIHVPPLKVPSQKYGPMT